MRVQVEESLRGGKARQGLQPRLPSQPAHCFTSMPCPALQEVLARHGSSQDLKKALRELLDEGGKLELDEGGLRALTDELGRLQVCWAMVWMSAGLPVVAVSAQDARLPPPPHCPPASMRYRTPLRMVRPSILWSAWSLLSCC